MTDPFRWTPANETEILQAIAEGTLTEGQHLDVKREIGDTSGSRKETARDLASFALDGGAMLIGVEEDKAAHTFTSAPQPLHGLAERIAQIASNLIDPPLFVRTREIATNDDPTIGYVVVDIPPSASAPHMVDHRYYARADRTKRPLGDSEVGQIIRARRSQTDFLRGLLHEEMERDPIPDGELAHFYAVAEPLQAPDELFVDLLQRQRPKLQDVVYRSKKLMLALGVEEAAPDPSGATRQVVRARGRAFTSFHSGARRPGEYDREPWALEIEFQEHGGIRVFAGRLSDYIAPVGARQRDQQRILEDLAVQYAVLVLDWVLELSKVVGYQGGWGFGVAARGLEGLVSQRLLSNAFGAISPVPYDRDRYEKTTTATLTEIENAPARVAYRLIGPLLRGLNVDHLYHLRDTPQSPGQEGG